MDLTRHDPTESIGRETARTVAKLVLGALSLVWLAVLVSLLPGIDRLLPATTATLVAIAAGIASLSVAGILVYVASGLAASVRRRMNGPRPLDEHLASFVHWTVILVAVLVAHWGLAPVLVPMIGEMTWLYDVVFFVLALPPVAIVATRLYAALDPAAEEVADSVAGEDA